MLGFLAIARLFHSAALDRVLNLLVSSPSSFVCPTALAILIVTIVPIR